MTTLNITDEQCGTRLDRILSDAFPDVSRSRLQKLITKGDILVNDKKARKKDMLHEGDSVSVTIPEDKILPINAETMTVPILFEDDWIIVVNKPPAMAVHPGAGNREGTLVNELLGYNYDQFMSMMDDEERPGIVHRLDKDTSGVMVIAKTATAKARLTDAFANRTVGKTYLAIAHGRFPNRNEVRVETNIARHRTHRQKMAVCTTGGKTAISIFSSLSENYGHHLIQATILTGRTHQIRVHLNHIGCPIVGDTVYGGKASDITAPRQMLHARKLIIPHPEDDRELTFMAPLPDDFSQVLTACGLSLE